jgi:hypothetical protein
MCLRSLAAGLSVVIAFVASVITTDNQQIRMLDSDAAGSVIGGGVWTSTDCEAGTGGCTSVTPTENISCTTAGVGPGGICPGTGWCSDDWVDEVCGAPFQTNNPFDLTCVAVTPSNTCDRTFRVCSAVSLSCSGYSTGGSPVLCGVQTLCDN